ncbi:PAS domain S-box-containing protein [Sphingomonas sp. F9_3S_D5_B_2]
MPARATPQELVDSAVEALQNGSNWRPVLDAIPSPVYVTDEHGSVTYWNRSCVAFAGREPQLGQDRWCVTWKIYTTSGDHLPHDQCPMAEAIRKRRPIRDSVAVALRPDGTRAAFRPYPTPLFGPDGSFKGAVNMLVDVTEEQETALRGQADHCRRIADAMYDAATREMLATMASGFERTANELADTLSD